MGQEQQDRQKLRLGNQTWEWFEYEHNDENKRLKVWAEGRVFFDCVVPDGFPLTPLCLAYMAGRKAGVSEGTKEATVRLCSELRSVLWRDKDYEQAEPHTLKPTRQEGEG